MRSFFLLLSNFKISCKENLAKCFNFLIILLIASINLKAQISDSTTKNVDSIISERTSLMAEITFKDGNILRGKIIKENSSVVIFKSDLTGEISISQEKILTIKFFDPENTGNQQVYVNLASRYFFSPSAFNMKKGDGYYQNTWFSLSTFNYAFSDYFTLGGGFELFSFLLGTPLVMITPKISIPISDNFHIGAGYMFIGVIGKYGEHTFGNIAYGNFTVGNPDLNFSVNAGTNIEYPGKPVLTLNAFIKMSPNFGFMTENWLLLTADNFYTIYSFGGRIIGRKNLFDFALITNPDIAIIIPAIPYLTYTLRF